MLCVEDAGRKPRGSLPQLARASLHSGGSSILGAACRSRPECAQKSTICDHPRASIRRGGSRRRVGVLQSADTAVLGRSISKTPCCKRAEVRCHQSQLRSSQLIVCSRQPSVVTRASADIPAIMRFAQLRPLSRPHAPEISEPQPSAGRSPERVRVSLRFVFTYLKRRVGVLTA